VCGVELVERLAGQAVPCACAGVARGARLAADLAAELAAELAAAELAKGLAGFSLLVATPRATRSSAVGFVTPNL